MTNSTPGDRAGLRAPPLRGVVLVGLGLLWCSLYGCLGWGASRPASSRQRSCQREAFFARFSAISALDRPFQRSQTGISPGAPPGPAAGVSLLHRELSELGGSGLLLLGVDVDGDRHAQPCLLGVGQIVGDVCHEVDRRQAQDDGQGHEVVDGDRTLTTLDRQGVVESQRVSVPMKGCGQITGGETGDLTEMSDGSRDRKGGRWDRLHGVDPRSEHGRQLASEMRPTEGYDAFRRLRRGETNPLRGAQVREESECLCLLCTRVAQRLGTTAGTTFPQVRRGFIDLVAGRAVPGR